MATRFELVLCGEDEAGLVAAGEAALAEIAEVERRLNLFDPSSLLARVNRQAAQRPVEVDGDTFALLELCAEVHAASQGAFDPTVAPLAGALGLQPGSPCAGGDLDAARRAVGWEAVALDGEGGTVRFLRPGMALDLGGIAKGHALDLAVEVLVEAGVVRALLHGGTSTAIALGPPPGQSGWRIALGPHREGGSCVLAAGALSVSAPHGRFLEREGQRLTHVLDPRRGLPTGGSALAAVLAPSGALADAWSTGLLAGAPPSCAGGPDRAARLVRLDGGWEDWGGAAGGRFEA